MLPRRLPRARGHRGRASPFGKVGANGTAVCQVILADRATSVSFTAVGTGPEWTPTDNTTVAVSCAVLRLSK
jgi:hypothetical protein